MLTKTALAQNSRLKIGWIILVIFAALMTFNHLGLIFFLCVLGLLLTMQEFFSNRMGK